MKMLPKIELLIAPHIIIGRTISILEDITKKKVSFMSFIGESTSTSFRFSFFVEESLFCI
jgi:hypothetical protein